MKVDNIDSSYISYAVPQPHLQKTYLHPLPSHLYPFPQTYHTPPPPLPLDRAPLRSPLHPRARVLPDAGPAGLAREPGRRATAHAGAAVEDDLVVGARPREAEAVLELLGRQVEAVGRRLERHVQRPRDPPRLAELLGLADVDEDRPRRLRLRLRRRRFWLRLRLWL